MKSTHILGTLELVGDISDLNVKDKWIVMNLRTTTPTGWNLKAALSHTDVLHVLKLLFRPGNLIRFIFSFCRRGNKDQIPEY